MTVMRYLTNLPQRISFNEMIHGYRVWTGGRNAEQVYFSSKEYGGLKKALQAAVDYEKTLPRQKRKGKRQHRTQATCASMTGIVGVCPYRGRSDEELGYRAFWCEDGKWGDRVKKTKDFPFSIWGRRALEEAEIYRKKKVLQDK